MWTKQLQKTCGSVPHLKYQSQSLLLLSSFTLQTTHPLLAPLKLFNFCKFKFKNSFNLCSHIQPITRRPARSPKSKELLPKTIALEGKLIEEFAYAFT